MSDWELNSLRNKVKKLEAEVSKLWGEKQVLMQDFEPGSLWRHYKGGEYEIVTVAIDEPTGAGCVVYTSGPLSSSKVNWIRTMNAFLQIVRWPDGRFLPRFIRLPDPRLNNMEVPK